MIVSHNTNYTIIFYNDRVKEVVPLATVMEPFTYIPILAGHMELLSGEQGDAVVFGKITEGYDVIDPNITTEITFEDVGEIVPTIYLVAEAVITNEIVNGNLGGPCFERSDITAVFAITIPERIYAGSTYFVNVYWDGGIDYSALYVVNPGDTLADIKNGWSNNMTLAGIEVAAGSPDNQIYIFRNTSSFCNDPWETRSAEMIMQSWSVTAYVSGYSMVTKFTTLKCGATHGFGIVYKDKAGRQCSVMKTNLLNVHIPFYTEDDSPELDERVSITFKIFHKPPEWADTYEIVFFGNISMDYFIQMRVDDIIALAGFDLLDHYAVNIQETIDDARAQNTRWKVSDYVWEEGDRIRFIGTIDDGGGGTGAITKYTELYDYEVLNTGTVYGEAVGGDYLYFQATTIPVPFVGEVNVLAEIYRPRKGLGITTPYGSGMVFEIGTDANGNRYHKGDVDQEMSASGAVETPAEVVNTAHDCYKYIRINYDHDSNVLHPFWAESIQPSDWWEYIVSNKLTNIGFPFLDDINQRQAELPERMRHGGFLLAGTRTNNLAHFTYEDFLDLPKKGGPITGLREVGYVLKVLQHYKETSIYVNRIMNFNADGTEEFTLTGKLLATVRPLEADYGCQHPDSVMVNNRNLYYWDNSQGAFIRSAPNGQVVLNNKTKRWFKDLMTWIRANGGGELLQVRVGANNEHDEVWISFRMGDDVTGLIFSEKDGRYKSRIDLITESYIHLGEFFAHLYHQRLWIINIDEGQDWLSWSGSLTHAEMELVSNIEPELNKVFTAIALYSDHEWESEAKSIVIPEEASAVNEIMESNVAIWDRREGVYRGAILKDENSKGTFVSVYDKKMNGRTMRGRYCFILLKTEEHDEKVRLDSIIVFSTLSERNL